MSVHMNDGVLGPVGIKSNPITEDYVVSRQVLGLGINGKVVECTNKTSGLKYALKVSTTTSTTTQVLSYLPSNLYYLYYNLLLQLSYLTIHY